MLLDTAGYSAAAGGVAFAGGVIYAAHKLCWLDPSIALLVPVAVAYQKLRLLGRMWAENKA